MHIEAYDIDGTIAHHDGVVKDWDDGVALSRATADATMVARIRRHLAQGGKACFITGRTEVVRTMTLQWLRQHVHEGIGEDTLYTQVRFDGLESMSIWKACVLMWVGAAHYTGDHAADAQAASLAGIPFTLHTVA